jgi:hypothetical protein
MCVGRPDTFATSSNTPSSFNTNEAFGQQTMPAPMDVGSLCRS